MSTVFLSILLIIAMIFSVLFTLKRRKKESVNGIKTFVPSLCFYLIAIVNMIAYWLNFIGVVSWTLTVLLLLTGAYFTKYLPVTQAKA
ncbi:LPXTG cell wall anchor domain-containing protein [Halobacillus rhizosphaerae]|uniref:LPXTG cell wall anchor domain-containing protein n=1 Tax=Halobacillus rhizosphaerae TaxID=3064889 RepID=UPI00398B668F